MSLVYIIAPTPWGPVRIETAADMGTLLRTITAQPAHVEDVGALDAGKVATAAREALPPAGVGGWIDARPDAAIRSLKEARARVSAMVVAGKVAEATPGPPDANAGAVPAVDALSTNANMADPSIEALAPLAKSSADEPTCSSSRRRRSSMDADVREIRAGLKMTQVEFAKAWGFSLAAVRDWEQGRAAPEPSTRVLLAVIAHRPDVVRDAMASM